jgi:PAS domain S-box-containing protein
MPKFNPHLWPKPPLILCYGVAALSVITALIIARWLEINLQTAPVSLFLCAVMLSAWFGGIGPGLLAAALSALAFAYYFLPPIYSLVVEAKEIPRFLIFALSAILVGSLSAAQRRAAESLRRARDDLDATVQELKRSNEALQTENAERTRVEEALRESEEQWRDVFENNPTMYFIVDVAGTVLSVNPFGADQLGYTVNELVGHSVLNVFYEADRDAVQRNVAICLEQLGQSMSWEFRKVRKDGRVIWVRETAKAVLREKIHPIVLIACEDITDRKRAEEALQKQARLLDLTHDTVFVRNMHDVITYWNRGAEELYGWKKEEACGKVAHQLLHTIFPAPLEEITAALHRTGRWEGELVHTRRDGTHVTVASRWALESDPQGNPLAVLETNNDITGSKQAAQALRQQANLLKQAHDAIFVWEFPSTIVYWNRGAEQLYGFSREEAIGRPSHELLHTEHPIATPGFEAVLERAGTWTGELTHTTRDGRKIIVESRHVLMREADGRRLVLETNRDITERKRTEATLEQAFQEIQVLKDQLYKENLALKEEIDRSSMFEEIVGASPVLQDVLARIAKVAPTDSTVLITGETGTGKELIARAIHKRSQRSTRAFVNVNCAATPPSLIASELFGHEKGAFTGALQRRLGRFELAEGGTIFLDEIGELPAETQVALLRVLQEREFERVGGTHTIRADVRVIAATNRDLNAAIAAGTFRKDLYYRLNVFPIESPPLRERQDDILLLVEYFIDRYASKAGKKIRDINKKTLELLQSYPWPGNIRELQNVIERSVIVCDTETFSVDEAWLSRETPATGPASQPLSEQLVTHEKDMIEAALAEARGRVSGPLGAAVKLGLPPSTLESKIRSLKISKHRFKSI